MLCSQEQGHRSKWSVVSYGSKKRRQKAKADAEVILLSYMVLTKQTLALVQADSNQPALLQGPINQR